MTGRRPPRPVQAASQAAACLLALGSHGARGQEPAPPPPPADYANPASWVCRPGVTPNACEVDLTATVVKADGSLTVEPFKPDPAAPIDCFYVYPTVSTDPGVLANLAVEPAEVRVVKQQFARFAAACRLYAPVYRQFTLTALMAVMQGRAPATAASSRPTTPYDDVRDAWNYYLAHDNGGRGVVLIGHSQGSGMLTQLIAREIDGKPAQGKLVSAILMGTSLAVPAGADVGGDFKSVPLCHGLRQLGCAIAFAAFRDNSPPPENARFGRPRTPGANLEAACVNPANLSGGAGELKSYLASGTDYIAQAGVAPKPWVAGKTVTTPFVTLPGMLTARCAESGPFRFLAIHVEADPSGPRTSDIPGDIVVNGRVLKDWGLHLIDANLTIGNLVDIVRQEGESWTARAK